MCASHDLRHRLFARTAGSALLPRHQLMAHLMRGVARRGPLGAGRAGPRALGRGRARGGTTGPAR
jgi:hypothetical protein